VSSTTPACSAGERPAAAGSGSTTRDIYHILAG
jgi:hypothetical protein